MNCPDDKEVERAEEFRREDHEGLRVPIVTAQSDGNGWRIGGPVGALVRLLGWRK
ncbi:MAG TPA: hypothetical protein VFD92_04680 [Candidatus Binatia bacterium]|nr:hypothetical protein [Candidatus Binatia bacterium]